MYLIFQVTNVTTVESLDTLPGSALVIPRTAAVAAEEVVVVGEPATPVGKRAIYLEIALIVTAKGEPVETRNVTTVTGLDIFLGTAPMDAAVVVVAVAAGVGNRLAISK